MVIDATCETKMCVQSFVIEGEGVPTEVPTVVPTVTPTPVVPTTEVPTTLPPPVQDATTVPPTVLPTTLPTEAPTPTPTPVMPTSTPLPGPTSYDECWSDEPVPSNITELVIGVDKCNTNTITELDLSKYPNLKNVTIGASCFKYVATINLTGLAVLERVVVGSSSLSGAALELNSILSHRE